MRDRMSESSTTWADVRPFSNGAEGLDWLSANCERCTKKGEPNEDDEGPCPMECAVSLGFIIGTVPADLAVEYGATIDDEEPGYCTMPRQCSQFDPRPVCEWISWPGTRRRQQCNAPMVSTVGSRGLTRAVCAKHAERFTKMQRDEVAK